MDIGLINTHIIYLLNNHAVWFIGSLKFFRKSSTCSRVAKKRPSSGRRVWTQLDERNRKQIALAVCQPPRLRLGVHLPGIKHKANGSPTSICRVGPSTWVYTYMFFFFKLFTLSFRGGPYIFMLFYNECFQKMI